jgi:putative membrane protein
MESKTIVQGAAIGAICGLFGAAAMNGVTALWAKFEKPQPQQAGEEDATVKTAEALAEPVLDRSLTSDEKKAGGPAVHFAFGASVGALYGALAPVVPPITVGLGVAYGTAVWLIGDGLLVPKLGLAPSASETPAKGLFKYWLMHAVYGLTLDTGRRLVLKRLG